MDHTARRAAAHNKSADEFYSYLRALQTRAMDISQTIAKLQLRERAPHWPRLLSQFAVLTSQLQTLYEELLTTERSWSGRLHSSLSLFHPLSPHYNPATALRIKPVLEIEELERECFEQFLKDEAIEEYSARELRDQINDFNAAALKLARWNAQAAAIPLPREPPVFAATAAAASAAASSTGGVAAPAATAASTAPIRRREDIDRSEDAELQKTLASMFTGRQTKLEPAQTQQPSQHHPPPVPAPTGHASVPPHPLHTQQQPQSQQQQHASHHPQQQQQHHQSHQSHQQQQPQQFPNAPQMTAQQQYALQQQLQQQQRQQQQEQQHQHQPHYMMQR